MGLPCVRFRLSGTKAAGHAKLEGVTRISDTSGDAAMRRLDPIFSFRRMLIGVVCGAGIGFLLAYAVVVDPSEKFKVYVAFACVVAVLGGAAGGLLKAAGWAMFAGAIIGAIAVGIFGVVATFHLKGVIFAFVGAPMGALVVFVYGISHEVGKPWDKTCVPPASGGVWDRELDQ